MKRNIKSFIILLEFVLVILIPILGISWKSGDYSSSEKRNLAQFPSVISEDGITLDFKIKDEFNSWFDDHIGFRRQMVQAVSWFKLNFLNRTPSDNVHIGKDDWYFYTLDNNLEIAIGNFPIKDSDLKQILNNMKKIKEVVRSQGREFVLVLPPSKVSIYPEYARYGSGEVIKTPVDIVADYLEENSDIKVVRLKEALLDAKEIEQVYFKEDTHWNEAGAYVAYKQIISNLQEWGLCDSQAVSVKYLESSHVCDLTLMMGQSTPEQTLETQILQQNAVKEPDGSDLQQLLKQYMGECQTYHYKNSYIKDKKAVFFGDSMFGSWNATELMAENFSEFTYIWNYNVKNEVIDLLDADIVFLEITERGILGLSTIEFDILQSTVLQPNIGTNQCIISDINSSYEVDISKNGTSTIITTTGSEDPQIVFKPLNEAVKATELSLSLSNIEKQQDLQLYYADVDGEFSESNSIRFTIIPEKTEYNISGFNTDKIKFLRLDFANESGSNYKIESITLKYS